MAARSSREKIKSRPESRVWTINHPPPPPVRAFRESHSGVWHACTLGASGSARFPGGEGGVGPAVRTGRPEESVLKGRRKPHSTDIASGSCSGGG